MALYKRYLRGDQPPNESGTQDGKRDPAVVELINEVFVSNLSKTHDLIRKIPAQIQKVYDEQKEHYRENIRSKERLIKELEWDLGQAKKELENKNAKISGKDQMLLAIEREKQDLAQDLERLRSVIVNDTSHGNIPDEEIKRRFAGIRQLIQIVAHSKALNLTDEHQVQSLRENPTIGEFYVSLGSLSTKERQMVVRAEIFRRIRNGILWQNTFGLGPEYQDDSTGTVYFGKDFQLFMEQFEKYMQVNRVSPDIITNWTHATFKCMDDAKFTYKDTSLTRDWIFDVLQPLLNRQCTSSDTTKLCKDISQLCDDAYNFRMIVRRSTETYIFEDLPYGTDLDGNESMAQAQAVQNGGKESKFVAFTICPALVKCGESAAGTRAVLEPAHVIVQDAVAKK
ncbi:hypothetical protein NOR_03481 [Metarhizium rileyi]|uniref:Uncharacterized protein n=1 Tax=Metarhizium rileyi (strain RCEF 4871) TaxID=1649241 RepID=A0A167FSJ2_METRR|nr:hypothetical protein NOR_03481 [Metarhizium rileyi RCEF 4871]